MRSWELGVGPTMHYWSPIKKQPTHATLRISQPPAKPRVWDSQCIYFPSKTWGFARCIAFPGKTSTMHCFPSKNQGLGFPSTNCGVGLIMHSCPSKNSRLGPEYGTQICFLKLFGHFWDIPAKFRDIPPKRFGFPGFEGHTELFAPPLHLKDPHPTAAGRYPDQKVWVWVPFSCLREWVWDSLCTNSPVKTRVWDLQCHYFTTQNWGLAQCTISQ